MLREASFEVAYDLSATSLLVRLLLSMAFGGLIGLERGTRRKTAGFRTYMLVCLGSTLTMLLGQYQSYMLDTAWVQTAAEIGVRTDISRFSAQVVNGIGFLGAGTIIVTGRQQVKGLTTAAALWASACMGLVIGAGYYTCVAIGFALLMLCVVLLNYLELYLVQTSRYMNLYIEFESANEIRAISCCLRELGACIYDIDLDWGKKGNNQYPSVVLAMRITGRESHAQFIHALFSRTNVRRINEI